MITVVDFGIFPLLLYLVQTTPIPVNDFMVVVK